MEDPMDSATHVTAEMTEVIGDKPQVVIFNPQHIIENIPGMDGVTTVTFAPKSRVTMKQEEISPLIQTAINQGRLELEPLA